MTGVLAYDGTTFTMEATILCFGCYNYLNTTITVEGFLRCQNTRLIVFYINGLEYRDCPMNFPMLSKLG